MSEGLRRDDALLYFQRVLNRITAGAIVLFWLVTGGLLVRTQLATAGDEAQPIPVAFVTRQMFRHEQVADLILYAQHRRLDGYLHLQPKHQSTRDGVAATGSDRLEGSGSFALSLPGMDLQRVTLRGFVEWNARQELQRIEVTANLHQPKAGNSGLSIAFEGTPLPDAWHYTVKEAVT